jgi:hypothetical protein
MQVENISLIFFVVFLCFWHLECFCTTVLHLFLTPCPKVLETKYRVQRYGPLTSKKSKVPVCSIPQRWDDHLVYTRFAETETKTLAETVSRCWHGGFLPKSGQISANGKNGLGQLRILKRVPVCSPSNRNEKKYTNFVDTMTSKFLHDLPFSRNQ